MSLRIISLLAVLRLLSVIAVQTFFSPDEYWQSTEIGHKLAFGWVQPTLSLLAWSWQRTLSNRISSSYGHSTWEWKKGIRSYLYPALVSVIYKILALLKQDSVTALVFAPRIIQALVSAYADYRFYRWNNNRKWSLFIIVSSWFWFYTGSRTLINTLEASLTTIAISFFPWGKQGKRTIFNPSVRMFFNFHR